MVNRMFVNVVLAAVMVPVMLQAGMLGWFGRKSAGGDSESGATNVVKRLHMTMSGADAEKEFLQLTAVKRILGQERQVLLLLQQEKRRAILGLDSSLTKSFGLKRDGNYRFDATSRALYEIPEGQGNVTNNAVAAKLVKKLDKESDARKFASLAAAKQLAHEDLTVLIRLSNEKDVEMAQVDKALKDKFSLSRDRNYWYDPKTKQLFELVDSSAKGDVK